MKLLIVDDNLINQKFLYYSLKKHFEIETVENGLQAVDLLEREIFDVVLMDLMMPVMDGADATWQIRESSKTRNKNIPIIFITTNDSEYERVRSMDSGADDYLIKPVDPDDLLQIIDNNINRKKLSKV